MTPSTQAARRLAVVVATFVFAIDIATKEVIFRSFDLHESMAITSFLNLGYWLNSGAAFSFLSDAGGWQRYFFSALALAVITWLSVGILFNDSLTRMSRMAFALIVGGAAGNVYDRIVRGAVVDWVDLHSAGWHWPAFNIADIGIVCGAALVVVASIRPSEPSTQKETHG